MAIRTKLQTIVIGCSVIVSGLILNSVNNVYNGHSADFFISDAEARRGRPMSPNSVAGVSRRTTRRAIRRSTTYVAVLPRSCTTVIIEGATLHHCGSTYYQPHNTQYVVVYVD